MKLFDFLEHQNFTDYRTTLENTLRHPVFKKIANAKNITLQLPGLILEKYKQWYNMVYIDKPQVVCFKNFISQYTSNKRFSEVDNNTTLKLTIVFVAIAGNGINS